MHALEVIIIRNVEAAGREAAHTDNDLEQEHGQGCRPAYALFSHGHPTYPVGDGCAQCFAFVRGYARGRQEG